MIYIGSNESGAAFRQSNLNNRFQKLILLASSITRQHTQLYGCIWCWSLFYWGILSYGFIHSPRHLECASLYLKRFSPCLWAIVRCALTFLARLRLETPLSAGYLVSTDSYMNLQVRPFLDFFIQQWVQLACMWNLFIQSDILYMYAILSVSSRSHMTGTK